MKLCQRKKHSETITRSREQIARTHLISEFCHSFFSLFLSPFVVFPSSPYFFIPFSLQANIKTLGTDAEIKDGERLPLDFKDMGSCEIYPQTISHNPNGRFVVVCGDGEYIIYTSMALRNKSFGSAQVEGGGEAQFFGDLLDG